MNKPVPNLRWSLRLYSCLLLFAVTTISSGQDTTAWQFIFMTDIHLQPESHATEGFKQAIHHTERFHPDFIVTGGDMIMDALAVSYNRADSLYTLLKETIKESAVPVHTAQGNHEHYGWKEKSGANPRHADYGDGMYERYFGRRYYSFDHKGWHFIVFDSVIKNDSLTYVGGIDSTQMIWLSEDLSHVAATTPIIAVTHIPLMTAMTQAIKGPLVPNAPYVVINNSREVLDAFAGHNLKLVLQGHMHYLEDIFVQGKTDFLTGGSVCSKWWRGLHNGLEEGYVLLKMTGDDFLWQYIDYGWEAETVSEK